MVEIIPGPPWSKALNPTLQASETEMAKGFFCPLRYSWSWISEPPLKAVSRYSPCRVAGQEDQGARAPSSAGHPSATPPSLAFFTLPVHLLQPLPGTNVGSFISQYCLVSKISFSFHPLGFPSHTSFLFYFCLVNLFPSLAFSFLLCSFPPPLLAIPSLLAIH